MINKIGHVTVLVKNYDEAIRYYRDTLGFEVRADNEFGEGDRWVSLAPPAQKDTELVLVEALTDETRQRVGNQAGDHVFIVVETDDCYKSYQALKAKGVKFFDEPKEQPWGIEVVFEDLYGNLFDLLQLK
jgi:catechol 2,3-dioxygenase-like lactoylglutathione lyase family enzyme